MHQTTHLVEQGHRYGETEPQSQVPSSSNHHPAHGELLKLEKSTVADPSGQSEYYQKEQQFDGEAQPQTTLCKSAIGQGTSYSVTFCDSETPLRSIATQTKDNWQSTGVNPSFNKLEQGILSSGQQTNEKLISGVTTGTQTPDHSAEQTVIESDSNSFDDNEWDALVIKSTKAAPQDNDMIIELLNWDTGNNAQSEPLSTTPHRDVQNFYNTYRVKYNPPERMLGDFNSKTLNERFDAPPQHEVITLDDYSTEKKLDCRYNMTKKPLDADSLKLVRSPLICPDAECKATIFISEFIHHMAYSHQTVIVQHLRQHQCVTFCLDPNLPRRGQFSVSICYMVENVINNLGTTEFKNFLPLTVLTTKVRLHEILEVPKTKIARSDDRKFLVIWAAGIKPEDFQLGVTLTAWHRSGDVPTCYKTISNNMDDIRMSGSVRHVLRNGNFLMLSKEEVRVLTNNRYGVIECQLQVQW